MTIQFNKNREWGDTLSAEEGVPDGDRNTADVPLKPASPNTGTQRRRNLNPMDYWRNRDMSERSRRRRKQLLIAFVIACVVTGISLLCASLRKVSSVELGVKYDKYKKQLNDAAENGGLFFGPPGFRFIKFPSTYITVDLDGRTCVSLDGLLVVFSATFQYQIREADISQAITKYRDFEKWAQITEQSALSAVHHSCSKFGVTEFQNKRGVIQSVMLQDTKEKLEGVHAHAVSLQLTYVKLPSEYNSAVAEKQAAEEDISLAKAQRKQETTMASTGLLKARKEAEKIKDTAQNEAELLITEARLKAEETLFSFEKEAEALVEVKERLNLTTEGVLAYLANKLLAEADTLKVTTGEPAKLSRKDEL